MALDGVTDDYSDLYTLINTTINGAHAEIWFKDGTALIGTSITIPSNVKLKFLHGGMLKPASGKVITGSSAKIEAGLHQIFDLSSSGSSGIAGVWDVTESYPEWFGAVGNGVEDDTTFLNYLIDFMALNGGGTVKLIQTYKTTDTITFDIDNLNVIAYGSNIKPATSVLIGVIIGKSTGANRLNVFGLKVDRTTYSGATENIGIKFLECNQSTLQDIESRFSKYNFVFAPDTGGFAYNTLINIQGIAGYYNFNLQPSGTGFVNENVFLGGRGFCTSDTNTNLYMPGGGGGVDHNRFLGMSLEGQGSQAVYCNTENNYFEFPRTEGTWTVNDVVFAKDSQYNHIITSRYDFTLTDLGTRNTYNTYGSGTKILTANNNTNTLTIERAGANSTNPTSAKTITAITKANPAVITSGGHGLTNGNYIRIMQVVGMTEVNTKYFKVANKTPDTFELQDLVGNNIDSSDFSTYVSGGYIMTGVPATSIDDLYSDSGYAQLVDFYIGRDGTGYAFRIIRATDGVIRASLTSDGILNVAQSLQSQQSEWNYTPLKLGNYTLWISSAGKLYIKDGVPANETDGTIVGTQS